MMCAMLKVAAQQTAPDTSGEVTVRQQRGYVRPTGAPVPAQGRLLSADELGNLYLVTRDNNLVRYGPLGDSNAFFRSIVSGEIGALDVTNPLRILVYYPAQARITVLDRMLAPKQEIDLRRLGITVPTAVATSADGAFWVYDPLRARLMKFAEDGRILQEGNDLRQELRVAPRAAFMMERNRLLYLSDTSKGVFLFDRFGTPVEQLPYTGLTYFQVEGSNTVFIYRSRDTVRAYSFNTMQDVSLIIPDTGEPILAHAVTQAGVWILRASGLTRYEPVH